MYLSRRKLKPRPHEHAGELNLVPYLDITVNLVMFMLLSITGLLEFASINVNAPKYGGGAGVGDTTEKRLLLTVAISKKGFFIAGAGAILGQEETPSAPASTAGEPTIPLRGTEYDFASLTEKLAQVKAAFPNETKVIFAADPDVRYETVVRTMDAAREHEGKPLFYDVSLSILAG
jgi:biopolymer transport protein ExbD